MTSKLRFSTARADLAILGITLRSKNEFDEYRVNFRGGVEATAYYTSDLQDAFDTGRAMHAKREIDKAVNVELADMDAWDEFVAANREIIDEQYGSESRALEHARDGGMTLGGGASPMRCIFFKL